MTGLNFMGGDINKILPVASSAFAQYSVLQLLPQQLELQPVVRPVPKWCSLMR